MAVAQCWTGPRRSATHEAVDWLDATVPPAWTQGAVRPPWTGDQVGAPVGPWSRSAAKRSAGPVACSAACSVRARLRVQATTALRTGSRCARAKGSMVSPLEIERPRPRLLGGPRSAGGLHHDGVLGVGHQEAVVVAELRVVVAARPALAVGLEQVDEHRHGIVGGGGPFEGEPQEVHAEQGVGLAPTEGQLAGEHGLVADDHAVLVGADLGAPHPPRLREQHGVGVGHLGDGDPGARDVGAGLVAAAGCQRRTWASLGSRSLFLAKRTPSSVRLTRVSHMVRDPRSVSRRRPRPGGAPAR